MFILVFIVLFFFFKQKTAYEMRISDWSSDVCSSDLAAAPTLDVVAIGNAIVDVLARSDDAFLAEHALTKGGMQLIDAETAESLYADIGAGKEISGGSAANTRAGLAAPGKKCGFIGQVHREQPGADSANALRAPGHRYDPPAMRGAG